MDISRMFRACKLGEIEILRSLIQTKEVDINFRDKFDSTPLYYACLCGHLDLVRLLLEQGAKCDVNTFDGERCVYAALTNDIRKLLMSTKYGVFSMSCNNDYEEFLQKSLELEQYCDVMFNVNGTIFKAHRYILMVRCEHFFQLFLNKWADKKLINIRNSNTTPEAFKVLLQFLYAGVIEFPNSMFNDVFKLFEFCKLHDALQQINSPLPTKPNLKKKNPKNLFFSIKLPVTKDYYWLHRFTLPEIIKIQYKETHGDHHFDLSELDKHSTADVIFKIDEHLFFCHKLFFAAQSDFFAGLIKDHFEESNVLDNKQNKDEDSQNQIPVFTISIELELFYLLTRFLYTNSLDITPDQAYRLFLISDIYLINSLKRYCSVIIGNNIDHFNPIDIIELARMFNRPNLETIAIKYIADNLNQFIERDDFKNLIVADANSVRERQETDTIDIIDDIRYYISLLEPRKNLEMMKKIDHLLNLLGLEA